MYEEIVVIEIGTVSATPSKKKRKDHVSSSSNLSAVSTSSVQTKKSRPTTSTERTSGVIRPLKIKF